MCDTLCVLGEGGTVFAKNSDRPPAEVQLVAGHGPRPAGGTVRTQYVEIPDTGAARTLLARPDWLWGAEHGVNQYGVAIGNEKIYTTVDPAAAPPALIGMDLVRLALERARTADEALDVVTELLAAHGQGGMGDAAHQEAYFSSFLLADRRSAWVLETAGSSWAARPVAGRAAISNRIGIGPDWTRGSADLAPGDDFDRFRKPEQLTGDADIRLAAAAGFLAAHRDRPPTPAEVVGHLRDHGHGPWGVPGSAPGAGGTPDPPPAELLADFTGISVCMHVRGYMETTSSMVAVLPADPGAPLRAWVATGNPCVGVFIPVFPATAGDGTATAGAVAPALADPAMWQRFRRIRDGVEHRPRRIAEVRQVLDPVEAELWEEADAVAGTPGRWPAAVEEWGRRVDEAATALAARF